jgi:hypothetical protein
MQARKKSQIEAVLVLISYSPFVIQVISCRSDCRICIRFSDSFSKLWGHIGITVANANQDKVLILQVNTLCFEFASKTQCSVSIITWHANIVLMTTNTTETLRCREIVEAHFGIRASRNRGCLRAISEMEMNESQLKCLLN